MGRILNYEEWKKLHREVLESFPGKTVMVFFSGGKDSSVALHLIQEAGEEFGFSFEAHAGMYPKHVFTPEDREKIDGFWRARGVTIQWHPIGEADERLAIALAEGVSPCLICNTAKKKDLMGYFRKRELAMDSLVIVMSYSLWDLVSASIEHILGSMYAGADSSPAVRHKPIEERYVETFQRFYPILKMKDGFLVFKPLIRYNDQEILNFISEKKIPILTTRCSYRQYRPKRHFSSYYERMNLRFDFDKILGFAQGALGLPDERFFSEMGEEQYLKQVI
jgi:hypothetical protein